MGKSLAIYISIFFAFIFLLTANASWDSDKGCMGCHEGIEPIAETPVMGELTCIFCHKGNAQATNIEEGHKGMFANPSDLRVIDQTCGRCHASEVENATSSLHATSAGIIASTRYAAGLQDREAQFGTYDVEASNKSDRLGTVDQLKQIPQYDASKPLDASNHIADDYLRNQCLRCHIWSDGHQRDGDYRASGCAACHVAYSNDGTYEGNDKAIDKTQKDRPKRHRISKKIDVDQCQHCHNRGARTGVSYMGMMESDGYGTPFKANGEKQGKLHGKNYNYLEADLHYQAGMSCIDCHPKEEMHGDGNLYTRKEHAVQIRCETCHGTSGADPTFQGENGAKLNNIIQEDGKNILVTKNDGKKLEIPKITKEYLSKNPKAKAAMLDIPAHLEKLECYACHARWAPQCYGCHAKQDISKASGDWLQPNDAEHSGLADPSKAGRKESRANDAYAWQESRSYLRWENPVLGIGQRGKVVPFIPGCQVIFSQTDGEKPIFNNRVETTLDGTSGLMHNPVQPHTTSKKARECVECHGSRKALGLGSGFYDVKANFPDGKAPIDFELERIVDEEGRQLQATAIEGARPFNKKEMEKISRVGVCITCHEEGQMGNIKGENTPTDKIHTEVIRKMTKKAIKGK